MAKTRREREKTEQRRVSARKRAETHKSGFEGSCWTLPEGVSLFKVKSTGPFKLDILSYKAGKSNPFANEGDLHFERTFFVHPRIGADENTYICPKKTCNKPCPICDHRAELMRSSDADEEVIKSLAPKERQLWLVLDHDNKEKGVQLWDVSYYLFGKQLDARVNNAEEDDDYEFFADPYDGQTLRVGFEEKSFAGNKFYETNSIDFKPRKENYDEAFVDKLPCLDDLLVVKSYDELKSIFLQLEEEEDGKGKGKESRGKKSESKPEKEAPTKEKSASPAKGRGKAPKEDPAPPAKDEDDDWDDDGDEGEEEEDAPFDDEQEEDEGDDDAQESEGGDDDWGDDEDWD